MGQTASSQPEDGKMKRLMLTKMDPDITKSMIEVQEADIPKPAHGQVLIKVASAPVNPSDYGSWKRPQSENFQGIPVGKEGSGTVVASGGGLSANGMVGKNVGFFNLPKGQGAYSEYVTVEAATSAFPMPAEVKVEDACSFFVNPYTVYGILETAKARSAVTGATPGLIHTGAASQVGQMMNKLAPAQGMTIVNVVRRAEQAEMLKELGANHVIVTQDPEWETLLKAKITELNINVAFDCVSGEMTGKLMSALPPGGTVYLYGGLSGDPAGSIPNIDMIYFEKKLEGWLLPRWLFKEAGNFLYMMMRVRSASACVNAGLASPTGWSRTQFTDCTMDEMWVRFLEMFAGLNQGGFTGQKLRIRFDKK